MSTPPGFSIEAAHEAFRSVLLALAHPGTAFPSDTDSLEHLLAAIYETDVPAWGLAGHAERFGREVPIDQAELVLIDSASSPGVLLDAHRGSEEHPEQAATIVLLPSAEATSTTDVVLSGPGVDGTLRVRLPLSAALLGEREAACSAPPLGIDLLLLDAGRNVIGLPRTTSIEVIG